MFTHEKDKLTDLIAEELGFDTPENFAVFPEQLKEDKERIRKAIDKYFEDKIAITWSIEDVICLAEEDGLEITDDEALDVLHSCLHKHDANEGINWNTLRNWLIEK